MFRETGPLLLTASTHHDTAADNAPCDRIVVRAVYLLRLRSGRLPLCGDSCGTRSVRMWFSWCAVRTATTQARQRGWRCSSFSLGTDCTVNIVPFIVNTAVMHQHIGMKQVIWRPNSQVTLVTLDTRLVLVIEFAGLRCSLQSEPISA